MIQKAFITGSKLQIGEVNRTLCELLEYDPHKIMEVVSSHTSSNLYWLQVDQIAPQRASDKHVTQKNYIYFDFDIRSNREKKGLKITNEEIKTTVCEFLKDCMDVSEYFKDWGYIIFTGNGLHVYFFGDSIKITSKTLFSDGMRVLCDELKHVTGEELDTQCVNPARIGRLPGSINQKNGATVEILRKRPEVKSNILKTIESRAEEYRILKMKTEIILNKDINKTIESINNIEIGELFATQKTWYFDGRRFFETKGDNKAKGCFVPPGENFVYSTGTDHLKKQNSGYSCFSLIKEMNGLSNKETYQWFESHYPHIRKISNDCKNDYSEITIPDSNCLFNRLATEHFDFIKTNSFFDEHNLFLKSAVTRIGAFSNMGKSKLAYYISHLFLKNGMKGAIFSTEVRDTIVLANMIQINDHFLFKDIIEHRVQPSGATKLLYKNLTITDTRGGSNELNKIETIADNLDIDFMIIDYIQGVSDINKSRDMYERLSNYGMEIQRYAQKKNIVIIDLSQVSNDQVKSSYDSQGFVGLKGSGDLYFTADVVLHLRRNKIESPTRMTIKIAKHKFDKCGEFEVECDFEYGLFQPFIPIQGIS